MNSNVSTTDVKVLGLNLVQHSDMAVHHDRLAELELHGAALGALEVAAPRLAVLTIQGSMLSSLNLAVPRLATLTLRLLGGFHNAVVRAAVPRLRSLTALDLAGSAMLCDSTLAQVWVIFTLTSTPLWWVAWRITLTHVVQSSEHACGVLLLMPSLIVA